MMCKEYKIGAVKLYNGADIIFKLTNYLLVWFMIAYFVCNRLPQGAEDSIMGILTDMAGFSCLESFFVYQLWAMILLICLLCEREDVSALFFISVFIVPKRITTYILQEGTAADGKEIIIFVMGVCLLSGIVKMIAGKFVHANMS